MSSIRSEKARIAALSRSRPPDDPEYVELRRNYRADRMAEYIAAKVAEAPPLTRAQRARLATLLAPPPRGAK